MLNHLFARFMQQNNQTNILQSAPVGECLHIQHIETFSEPCLLRVAAKQQVCLVQNGWRSPIYQEGEYALSSRALSALNPNMPLQLIFLHIEHSLQRNWQHQGLHLQGQYQLRILNSEAFLSQLLSLSPTSDLSAFDQWLVRQIEHIVQEQQISAQDVQDYPQRLALFLKDVLNARLLNPQGMTLDRFSADYEIPVADTAAQENAVEKSSAPIAETASPSSLTTTAQENEVAEFYCAMNGGQQGPYRRQELQNLINSGEITPQTLVWKPGLHSWQAIKQFSEFQWHDKTIND